MDLLEECMIGLLNFWNYMNNLLVYILSPLFSLSVSLMIVRPTPVIYQPVVIETKEELSCRPCGMHGKSACPLGHFACGNISIPV